MNKFCIFPIKDNEVWAIYKKQFGLFWTVEEIDFSNDYKHFMDLDDNIKHIIKMILIFFSNTDGLVNYNISKNFLEMDKEIVFNYVFQMLMEQIHNETYSLMIETLISDKEEKEKIFNSLYNFDIIKDINNWGLKYSNGDYSLGYKILAFLCFEGIMFSGAFSLIFWIKYYCSNNRPQFMNGLIKSNEFISRDEGIHMDFGILLFNRINAKEMIPDWRIKKLIIECVKLTKRFNKEVLLSKEIGLNLAMLNTYTEYMTDRILVSLGLEKHFKVNNPFQFMSTIGMLQKTNFHESRPTEYQKVLETTEFELYGDDEF
jgi:ribonucleoside-diphosphate reductase beta chain